MNKQNMRKEFLQKRAAIELKQAENWSQQICKHLLSFVATQKVSTIAMYAAFRHEPDLKQTILAMLTEGKTVAFPKCGKEGVMTMYAIAQWGQLESGKFGILEPLETNVVSPADFDVVVVPGCAFGKDMSRLGYGGGYYDRYLPRCIKAKRVGICFDACLTDSVPSEPFDCKMDYVITENGILNACE